MDRPRGQNYLHILKYLISIHTKLNTRITNIIFVAESVMFRGGKCEKVLKKLKLNFSTILITIPTKHDLGTITCWKPKKMNETKVFLF